MGQTVCEKILSRCSGALLGAGDQGICDIDLCFSNDISTPAIVKKIKKKQTVHKNKYIIFLDHNNPAPDISIAKIHSEARKFAEEKNVRLFDVGSGVSSQLIWENNLCRPADVILGTDKYIHCLGALGVAAANVKPADIMPVLAGRKVKIPVPPTYKIILKGRLSGATSAKDIALFLISKLNESEIKGKAIEITGSALDIFSLQERMTILSSFGQTGIKFIFCYPFIDKTGSCVKSRSKAFKDILPDADCLYEKTLEIDIGSTPPLLSRPHSIFNVSPVRKNLGITIEQAVLGGGSEGRLSDLREAAKILKGRKLKGSVRFFIVPASRNVWHRALKEGIVRTFIKCGAVLLPPGYGPCEGDHQGVPADREVVISTANNNSRGIMGNDNSSVYLSSASTVIASAIKGKITEP